MQLIEKLRQKSPAEKMRIVWIVAGAVAVALIAVWVISAKYYKNASKDKTLFETLSQGIKDIRDNFRKSN